MTATKIAATKIAFGFSEAGAPIAHRTFEGTKTLTCWQQAGRTIRRHAASLDPRGGYDKTDFVVTFANGDTYQGRIDIQHKHHSFDMNALGQHIWEHCSFVAGRRCPARMDAAEYARQLANIRGTSKKACGDFLDAYEIPHTDAIWVVSGISA